MKGFVLGLLTLFLSEVASAQEIPAWKMPQLEARINQPGNDLLVINFWATFCKPCIAEIPHFIRIAKEYPVKTDLLLVSLDVRQQYPQKLKAFVKKHGFGAPVAWLDETNADYFCPKVDSSWSGSIPATLIINRKTGYRKFYETEMNEEEFRLALDAANGLKP